MIIVVSHPADVHAGAVLAELDRRRAGKLLFDYTDFPQRTSVTSLHDPVSGQRLSATVGGLDHELAEVGAVWWRRPQAIVLHPDMARPEDREFAFGECHAALTGLWSCLDATWINDPELDLIASRKLLQLRVAHQLGFRTPRGCITNDPAQAARFLEEQGGQPTIYKAFAGTETSWRETRVLRGQERELLDAVRLAPVIFQECIPAAVDLRITVVGDQVFATEIRAHDADYQFDFRMVMDRATLAAHELPDDVRALIMALMRRLGLVYGAIDMRVTPDGEYVFLEINPAGQYLFVEVATGQRITEALCDTLIGFDRDHLEGQGANRAGRLANAQR